MPLSKRSYNYPKRLKSIKVNKENEKYKANEHKRYKTQISNDILSYSNDNIIKRLESIKEQLTRNKFYKINTVKNAYFGLK